MIKFARQQSVNNLHIPFASFDLVPNFYKGLTSRYCNRKWARCRQGAMVAGGGEGEPMWEPDWSQNFKEKWRADRHLKKSHQKKFNWLSSFLPFSTVYHTSLPASAHAVPVVGVLGQLTSLLLESDCGIQTLLSLTAGDFSGGRRGWGMPLFLDNKDSRNLITVWGFSSVFVLSLYRGAPNSVPTYINKMHSYPCSKCHQTVTGWWERVRELKRARLRKGNLCHPKKHWQRMSAS